MSDSYYELVDADEHGERFRATDMVHGTLFDASGPVGGIQQSVLVRPRPAT